MIRSFIFHITVSPVEWTIRKDAISSDSLEFVHEYLFGGYLKRAHKLASNCGNTMSSENFLAVLGVHQEHGLTPSMGIEVFTIGVHGRSRLRSKGALSSR
jgi:hypothetical protein